MLAPAGEAPAHALGSVEFRVSFSRYSGDLIDVDNGLFIGTCGLRIEQGTVSITGRRYPSQRQRQRIRHGYTVTHLLAASIIGLALYHVACTYVYIANNMLTHVDTLVIDLERISNVSCEFEATYFQVHSATGEQTMQFVAVTRSLEASVALVKQLTAKSQADPPGSTALEQ